MSLPAILLWSANADNRETLLAWLAPLGHPVSVVAGEDMVSGVLSALQDSVPGTLIIDTDDENPAFFSLLNRLQGEAATSRLPIIWVAPSLAGIQRRLHVDLLYGIDVLPKPCQPAQLLAAATAALQQDGWRALIETSHAGADWQSTQRQGLLGLASDGRILYANPASARLLRMPVRRLVSVYWQSLMENPVSGVAPKHQPALAAALEQHSAVEVQRCPLWQEDGRRIVCHAAVAPLDQGDLRMLFAFRELPPEESGELDPATQDFGLDMLTGLPRNHALMQAIEAMLRREDVQPALLLMDIDHLRHVNETLGYEFGDKLLQQGGERLRQAMDGVGLLFRVAGDRFAALLDRVHDFREAGRVAQRLNAQFRHGFLLTGHEVYCGLSVGVALWPGSGDTAEALVQSAEVALERAKSLGRNVVQFYSADMNRHSLEQLERETALHKVLARPELPVRMVPWTGPDGAVVAVSPRLDWAPEPGHRQATAEEIADESGLTCVLGRRLIHDVLMRMSKADPQAGLPGQMFSLSLNCLRDPRTMTRLSALLAQHVSDTNHVQLNLALPAEDWAWAEPVLRDLAGRGVRLGLLVSRPGLPLEPLGRLPWQDLVLDAALVRNGLERPQMASVLTAIAGFGHQLGLRVMADGVDGPGNAGRLYQYGIDACGGSALVGASDTPATISVLRDSFNKLKLRY